MSLVIRKLSVRLKHMRMTANDHINTLLHQKSGPLFLVFIWHGFIFCSPVSHKDDAVADFFGFLDHCGDLILIKDIDHVFISFSCTGIIGAVCIVKKSNLNTIHFFYFDSVCIFLGGVDAKYRNIRIIGAPEIQSTFQIVISIIIGVICGRFHYIKPCFDNGISHFLGSGKRRISADSIVAWSKNRFLVDHGYVCSLDLVQNMSVDMVIIPYAGVIFAGFIQLAVIKIISNSNYTCSGDDRCFSFDLILLFLESRCFCCFFLRFTDQGVIHLMHHQNEQNQNNNRTQKTDPGVDSLP